MIIKKATWRDNTLIYYLIPHKKKDIILKLFKYNETDEEWQLMGSALLREHLVGNKAKKITQMITLEKLSRLSFLVLTGWDSEELYRIGVNGDWVEGVVIRK